MTDPVVLDCTGLLCPLPVLRTRKKLLAMTTGQILWVLATDPMAAIDLPHFCSQAGHSYLGCTAVEGATRYMIACANQNTT
jgi:tRNA 2-thiouridine synthesizing protein A